MIAKALRSTDSAHWYSSDGEPHHFVEKKDGSGSRPATLGDARKNNWLPGVSTVLKVLAKPALTSWLIEQACMAVLTSPRVKGEPLDAFVTRVLGADREQDQESRKARDLGTEIHDALEMAFTGGYSGPLARYVTSAMDLLTPLGRVMFTERILVGNGYAGRTDVGLESDVITLVDFKSCKNIPKECWSEHRLQLSAYAKALGNTGDKRIETANLYISTSNPGEVKLCPNPDWETTFEDGFKPLLQHWNWMNDYWPQRNQ